MAPFGKLFHNINIQIIFSRRVGGGERRPPYPEFILPPQPKFFVVGHNKLEKISLFALEGGKGGGAVPLIYISFAYSASYEQTLRLCKDKCLKYRPKFNTTLYYNIYKYIMHERN